MKHALTWRVSRLCLLGRGNVPLTQSRQGWSDWKGWVCTSLSLRGPNARVQGEGQPRLQTLAHKP